MAQHDIPWHSMAQLGTFLISPTRSPYMLRLTLTLMLYHAIPYLYHVMWSSLISPASRPARQHSPAEAVRLSAGRVGHHEHEITRHELLRPAPQHDSVKSINAE